MSIIVIISIGIALFFPFLFTLFLRKLDLLHTGKAWKNNITLLAGLGAYLLAAQINPAIVHAGWGTWEQVIRLYAPIVEEILKSLIIIYLVSRADFNYIVDGAIYGFGVGIGFAMVENIEYIMNNSAAALVVALARVFSTNLVHATGSGLIGTALAYRRGDKTLWRVSLFILLGYGLAIFFHALFNTMVNAGTFIAVAIGYGVLGVGLIRYLILQGLKKQKEWVSETLGEADRITKEETKVIRYIETVDKALAPIEQRFGKEKANLVRTLIYKQAEMGIKKKLIETDTSTGRKVEIQKIIDELREDMDSLRKQIGTYCMMMVREVYLGQELQVFNLLNARIASAGPVQKGGGVWNTLSEKMNQPATEEENQL